MNILMLRPQLELGGVSAHMQLLALGLCESGQQVWIGTAGGEQMPVLGAAGLALARFPLYPSTPPHFARAVVQLCGFVRRHRIDLLHSHHRFTTIVGRAVQRVTGVPLVATVHEFKRDGRATAWLWARGIRICPSQALKDHLVQFYGANSRDVFVVPNALASVGTALPASAAPNRTPTIGFIGRLSPEKGARYFLEILVLLGQRFPQLRGLLIGAGPEAPALRAQASALGLDPGAIFLGARTDIAALLETIDVLVIPSLTESFSMVALEAMRAGVPVVASAVGGLPEVVRDHETGLLAAPASPESFAEKAALLLENPALRAQLGARGRQLLHECYAPATMVARTLQVYQVAQRA